MAEVKYRFRSDVKPGDLWLSAMRRIYRSLAGAVNIIFTVSVIVMTVMLFGSADLFFRIMMIIMCLLFPVIQPLAVYGKSVRNLEGLPADLVLEFGESGMCAVCGGKRENIAWKKVTNAIRSKDMIIIMTDTSHGYMITNRELGNKKDEFFDYLSEKISPKKNKLSLKK